MTKTCHYCQQPYDPGPQGARRTYCFAEACALARRAARRAYKADFDRRHKAERALPSASFGQLLTDAAGTHAGRALRLCLRCDAAFASSGAHNRICPACKDAEGWRRARTDQSPLYW